MGALVLGTVLVAALSGLLLHHACTHMPPPLDAAPDPGTPRAAYCDATDRQQPWLVMGLAALLSGGALSVARRFRLVWSVGIAAALCITFLVAASVAFSLDPRLTV